jgi:periplasmic protein CpxP/Spy
MTPRLRHLIAGLGLALATATSFAAPAMDMPLGGKPPPPIGPCHEPVPPFLHGVALTEDQRDKVFEITYAQMPNLRAREKEIRRAHEGLIKLSLSTEFDDIKAKALANASAEAMSDVTLIHARLDNKIFGLLTPEQRKQIEGSRAREEEHCGEPRIK